MTCAQCSRPSKCRGLCLLHYGRQRRRLQAYGRWESKYVDVGPVREHLTALRAAGVGNMRLRELTGVSHNTIQVIMTGRPERGSGPTKQVLRRTADKILAVPVPDVPHEVVADGAKIPAVGTRRRLQALVRIGYSRSYLCRRIGTNGTTGWPLFGTRASVQAGTARAVAALFEELQLTPGPSSRARNDGARRGWPPPLAWDEDTIDDPDARPLGQRRRWVA